MLEADVCWAAGFWEGEGSISTRSVTASQVDAWPLVRLQKLFGGTISIRKSTRKNQRECHQWFLCGESARLFIELISPYLSPRRQQQIQNRFITANKRQRIRASIKPMAQELASLRKRDENGRFTNAPIFREAVA